MGDYRRQQRLPHARRRLVLCRLPQTFANAAERRPQRRELAAIVVRRAQLLLERTQRFAFELAVQVLDHALANLLARHGHGSTSAAVSGDAGVDSDSASRKRWSAYRMRLLTVGSLASTARAISANGRSNTSRIRNTSRCSAGKAASARSKRAPSSRFWASCSAPRSPPATRSCSRG